MIRDADLSSLILVAIAYLMQKAPYVFPIIGGRKIEHLYANLEALELSLTPEQIKTLDDIVPFDKGFPFSYFVRVRLRSDVAHLTLAPQGDGSDYSMIFKMAGHFDKWPAQQAIRPAKQ